MTLGRVAAKQRSGIVVAAIINAPNKSLLKTSWQSSMHSLLGSTASLPSCSDTETARLDEEDVHGLQENVQHNSSTRTQKRMASTGVPMLSARRYITLTVQRVRT